MRISTSQIYDNGTLGMQRNQSALYKLQNQISTGRRVLTPEDDPVAAAQALIVTQSKDVNAQHADNQGSASSQLGLVDSQLNSMVDLLNNVRDRVVQAGNSGAMTNSDRQTIATELEARLSELVGLANSQNGAGDYLFSGYQGATLPFAINGTTGDYVYAGDDGERLLQVSSSRQMAVNVAGSDVFMDIKGGNGTFTTATGGNNVVPVGNNKGSGTIDTGSVVDVQKWQAAVNLLLSNPLSVPPVVPMLQIRFSTNAVTGASEYQLFDATPATPVAVTSPATFTPGMSISLDTTTAASPSALPLTGTSFGAKVVIQGQPAAGDSFSIKPSSSQSIFLTMQSLIKTLRTPINSTNFTSTEFTNALGAQLNNIDQTFENVSRVQAIVGTRMAELDSLGDMSSDLDIQYQSSLSDLQDLDVVKAYSDLTLQKVNLEAAQKSFVTISGLSLFNYL